ncbi:integrase core domain-containing protein [Streptomyces chryseus]
MEMAILSPDRDGLSHLHGLVYHSAPAVIPGDSLHPAPVRSRGGAQRPAVGYALDNARMESPIGLLKTETIKPGGPWRTLDDAELATLTWIDWCNNRRLHSSIGDLPPTEYETVPYRSPQTATTA